MANFNVECELCGGKDFYKEAGYFYCNECQTQTQDLREQEFEFDVNLNASTIKKSKSPGEKSKPNTLTSWECYNYILYGLVNELLELGANKNLKKTVKIIWLKYLKKLGVVSEDNNHAPQLAALNSKRDAHIIYGVNLKRKRKRKKSSSSGNSSSSVSTNIKLEINKRKRALIKVEQDALSSHSQSLHSQNISSFRDSVTASCSSSSANMPVQYNSFATNELKKLMCHPHLMAHRKDKLQTLNCHKISGKTISAKYVESAFIITRKRIFAILYLSLIIIKDKIQLSDMLRYINEGHLSYNEYLHFFPETLGEKKLNISSYAKCTDILTHSGIRETAWKIVEFLHLEVYIPMPNIVELSERYCLELNLPEEIHQYVVSIISHTLPYLRRPIGTLPNYEGRTISYIIFILKLLFGLDDKSEHEFAKFANIVNERSKDERQMFNLMDWLSFIEYRKRVLRDNHFPCHSKEDKTFSKTDLFVNFMKQNNIKYDIDCHSSTEHSILKDLLIKLSNLQMNEPNFPSFPHSLTPYHTYLRIFMGTGSQIFKYKTDILKSNFRNLSLDFLLYSDRYLSLNSNLKIRHCGANDNLEFISTFSYKRDQDLRKKIPVLVIDVEVAKKSEQQKSTTDVKKLTDKRMEEYLYKNKYFIDANIKKIKKETNLIEQDFYDLYNVHYQPYERFLLRVDKTLLTEEEFEQIFNGFSLSFQIIFKECARITEQSLLEFYNEYRFVEQYLCYNFHKKYPILDKRLEKLISDQMKFY